MPLIRPFRLWHCLFDKSVGFESNRDLTRSDVHCVDLKYDASEPHRKCSGYRESSRGYGLRLKSSCVSFEDSLRRIARLGYIPLKVHPLNHPVKDVERFGSMPFTNATRFEPFDVLVKQTFRLTF